MANKFLKSRKVSLTVVFLFALVSLTCVCPVLALDTAFYITDASNNPLNGVSITIYYATSTSGPFTPMPSTIVYDKVAGTNENPIVTGYWNPTHNNGIGLAQLSISGVSGYYFYCKLQYNSQTWFWPIATSTKPGDSTWAPVAASGSPTGYAAAGNGFGNGVTTGFPDNAPPFNTVPEVPIGIITASLAMAAGCGVYFGGKKLKTINAK